MKAVFVVFTLFLSLSCVAQQSSDLSGNYHGDGISFQYPQSWISIEQPNKTVVFYPTGARYKTLKGDFYSHGFYFGIARLNAMALDTAAESMFSQMARSNPTITKIDQRTDEQNGVNRILIRFHSNEAISPSGPESGVLVLTGSPAKAYFWIMFAPDKEIERYWQIYNGVLSSARSTRAMRQSSTWWTALSWTWWHGSQNG